MNYYDLYSAMPIWLQNCLCTLKGHWLQRQRYGGVYQKIFDFVCTCDEWTEKQIVEYKEQNIARILQYAYLHCPYYRARFDDANVVPSDFTSINDLAKFPILTKEDVRMHWKEMISDECALNKLIKYHTSGSTGKALDFFWTKESLRWYWAIVWRGRHRFGIERGDLHLNFTGKIVVPIAQNKPPYWRYNRPINQYMLNMQHITQAKVEDIVKFINKINAKFFVGYPSIINSLAVLINENNLQITKPPKYIFSSAEKLYDFQENNIRKAFPGVQIVEHYGFSENAGAASKGKDGFYYEDFEMGHLELHDPIVLSNGAKQGEMLATGFKNLGMPFIRYQIGDTATFTDKSDSDIDIQSAYVEETERAKSENPGLIAPYSSDNKPITPPPSFLLVTIYRLSVYADRKSFLSMGEMRIAS